MSISSRIEETVERWSGLWRDRLKDWMASWLAWGLELILDTVGRGLGKRLDTIIDLYAAKYDIPAETVAEVKEAWKGEGEWQALLGGAAGGTAVGSLIGSTLGPFLKLLEYKGLGLAKSFRLDPLSIITAWRRDKATWEKLFEDLKDQGWDEDRIEALKFITLVYPSPRDLIEFQAHEVFEPDMIAKYGLNDEVDKLERDRFYQIGMNDELIEEHWRNHWVHPAWVQVLDMYHRGVLTYDDIWAWFRLVEIPPYWRDKMIEISWDLPNRIETRMMARYGLVDKAWLVEHLKRIGLHEDYRSIAADFMLAMGIRMDISARYSKGWLTADQVKSEIAATGLSPEIADRLYMWIVKNVRHEEIDETKKLNESVIIKALKEEQITRDECIDLLVRDRNYSREDAEFVVDVKVGALGSPETYLEFLEVIEKHRKAQGLEAKIPPKELIEANKALREAELALKEEEEKKGVGKAKSELYKAVSDATYLYKQLLTQWKAESSTA